MIHITVTVTIIDRYAITPRHHLANDLSKSDTRIAQMIKTMGQQKKIN